MASRLVHHRRRGTEKSNVAFDEGFEQMKAQKLINCDKPAQYGGIAGCGSCSS
jgi:hypothetical protein